MSERLSSDILEEQFGPTILKVLRQDGSVRLICTKTGDGRVLELSLVRFSRPGAAEFPDPHDDVLAGRSMGKAFRDHGVEFERQVRGTYSWEPAGPAAERFGVPGKATVVDVSVLAGAGRTPYADILEIYSPAVDWPAKGAAPPPGLAERLEAFDSLLTD